MNFSSTSCWLLLCCGSVGCSGSSAFEDPGAKVIEQLGVDTVRALQAGPVRLLALHPAVEAIDQKTWADNEFARGEILDGYPVLGECELDAASMRRVIGALFRAIDDNDGTVAGCFNPRHGLRVEHQGKRFELVICFECMSLHVLADGERVGAALTTAVPSGVFNGALGAAGVPLAVR